MFKLLIRKNKIYVNGYNCKRKFSEILPQDKIEENSTNPAISRNKSGLLNQHRNVLYDKTPYSEPNSWIHLTEKYQRKVFGRYGAESGISCNICFNVKSSKAKDPYEELVENESLQSMIHKHNAMEKSKLDEIAKRENEISKKLEKLNQWKQELHAKIHKKEADAIAAKEKRNRLIEEVRRHFGYKIDIRDERFKEMLEQKEREDKKKQKEAKRKAKEQKLLSKHVENPVEN